MPFCAHAVSHDRCPLTVGEAVLAACCRTEARVFAAGKRVVMVSDSLIWGMDKLFDQGCDLSHLWSEVRHLVGSHRRRQPANTRLGLPNHEIVHGLTGDARSPLRPRSDQPIGDRPRRIVAGVAHRPWQQGRVSPVLSTRMARANRHCLFPTRWQARVMLPPNSIQHEAHGG